MLFYHVCTACWEISIRSLTPWCKIFPSFLISTLVPLTLDLPMKSHLRSGQRCQTVVTTAVRIGTLSVHRVKLNLV